MPSSAAPSKPATRQVKDLVLADAERRLGRLLTPGERHVDLLDDSRRLDAAKDRLEALIEAEKRRAIRELTRTGQTVRLQVTDEMMGVLRGLFDAGRAAARREARSMGVQLPRELAARDEPRLEGSRRNLGTLLAGIAGRTEREAAEVDWTGQASHTIERELERRVPGARDAASRLVSTAHRQGLASVYEDHQHLFGGWTYSGAGDAAMCDVCRHYDGTRFDTLDQALRIMPGFGPNPVCRGDGRCRCRLVPEPPLDDAEPELGPPEPELWDHAIAEGTIVEGDTVRVAPWRFHVGGDLGYETGEGSMTRHRGTTVFIEDGAPAEALDLIKGFLDDLPPSARIDKLHRIHVFTGRNPGDAHWEKAYNMPGFEAAATGGHGGISYWGVREGPVRIRRVRDRGTFDHELGHVLGERAGPIDLYDWQEAARLDEATSLAKVGPRRLARGDWRTEPDVGEVRIGRRAVTDYGSKSWNEDWAESVRLYLHDRRKGYVGRVYQRDRRGLLDPGRVKRLRFRQLWPERARLLDDLFGENA